MGTDTSCQNGGTEKTLANSKSRVSKNLGLANLLQKAGSKRADGEMTWDKGRILGKTD